MLLRTIIFLVINFAALGIGGFFTGKGVPSEWYANLNKAPWTPPGWFFGFAWTTIMICFAIYMALLFPKVENKQLLIMVFGIQWVLNVIWNPTFFYFHYVLIGLLLIITLTIVVGYFLFNHWANLKAFSLLIAPYFIWLLVASSLNAYILLKN